jgi:lipopolysaccharide transport system permease protein
MLTWEICGLLHVRGAARMADAYHLCIRASRGFRAPDLLECWNFRALVAALAMRDIKLRYRQTALGIAWVILQPLIASGVLAFVFGTIAQVTRPERSSVFIFVLGGFIGWTLFSATFTRAGQSLLQHSMLISKVYFPRLILPISVAASGLLDAGVGLAFFAFLKLLSGSSFGLEIITLPLWLAILVVLALGLGLISAALSVRFRDVQHITPVFIQTLFYASPVAYQMASVPKKWLGLFSLNPMAPLLEGLRWSLLGEGYVRLPSVIYLLCTSLLILALGLLVFRRAEREFADVM